ncbi:glutamate-5-semialdehyde dehydrogenase [Fibrobacterota bacterium]
MTAKLQTYSRKLGQRARQISHEVRKSSHTQRVGFLKNLAGMIHESRDQVLRANRRDLAAGKRGGMSGAMLDRLMLDDKRLDGMVNGVLDIAKLPEPLGRELSSYLRKDKLSIRRFSVPIGSIFFIFESRPNVAVDGAALCIKSGNTVILRGGKESACSNRALVAIIRRALRKSGISADAAQLVNTADYRVVNCLLADTGNIDLVIPRGGERLIQAVVEKARVPVIKHYKGVCHIYLDKSADMGKAGEIILNAKIQRPGVCNAMETLLIDKKAAKGKVLGILNSLRQRGVDLRGCPLTRNILPGINKARAGDWDEEYLDLRLSVRIVDGAKGAVEHVRRHGSGHTDAILAQSALAQKIFVDNVDSSSIMINASTRFSDGGEYGLGAEVGISTDKLHARGPMGIESLTTYQWRVEGNGHIRGG